MKTRSNEKLNSEAEKCLAQSEKFQNEKTEFETKIYSKVLTLLTSLCTIYSHWRTASSVC